MSEHNSPITVLIYHPLTSSAAYWAFVYHTKGSRVYGQADSRTEIVEAFPAAYFVDTALSVRDFEYTTNDWGYAGCTCEQLQTYVKKGLSNG
jgi:hypothetical protein